MRDGPDVPRSPDRPTRGPIELKVAQVGQIFHALDPLPYREKDLDPRVEEFVVDWARELTGAGPIEIRIHLPASEAERPAAGQVEAAIRAYFASRAEAIRRQHRELMRLGRASLAVGICILAVCIVAAHAIVGVVPGSAGEFLAEGLFILGWVANWRPIEIFLYDWWPLVRRRRLYERLSRCRVRLDAQPAP